MGCDAVGTVSETGVLQVTLAGAKGYWRGIDNRKLACHPTVPTGLTIDPRGVVHQLEDTDRRVRGACRHLVEESCAQARRPPHPPPPCGDACPLGPGQPLQGGADTDGGAAYPASER